MTMTIKWNTTKGDTVNGYGIEIHYSYTSFDENELKDIKEWCENNIGAIRIADIGGNLNEHISRGL